MKKITVELDGKWVLKVRESGLPNQIIEQSLGSFEKASVQSATFTQVVVTLPSEEASSADKVAQAIRNALVQHYSLTGDQAASVISIEITDAADPAPSEKQEEKGETAQTQAKAEKKPSSAAAFGKNPGSAEPPAAPEDILAAIRKLKGADEFISLCEEITALAPLLQKHHVSHALTNYSYLFSINHGFGCTTALKLLAQLMTALDLITVKGDPTEVYLPADDRELAQLANGYSGLKNRIICFDMSEWMDKASSPVFREFILKIQKMQAENIVVFRIPYIEMSSINRIVEALSDVMSIRALCFVPLSAKQLQEHAGELLNGMEFTVEDDAWNIFRRRINEEKSDGRFYGTKTVSKVIDEMLLAKMYAVLAGSEDDNIIRASDIRTIIRENPDDENNPQKLLDEMVGIESIRDQLNEIITQIEYARKTSGVGAPSMHMRFLGSPGTGKTTVARYIGAIFAKRGLLSNGMFIEHHGSDFIAKYVGHTASLTNSICRDAYGSVLFIDEAYSLANDDYGEGKGFSHDAIDALIAQMENHREDMVVIMAGYEKDMERLNDVNPGLASRMPYTLRFPNFTREQLFAIYMQMAQKSSFTLDPSLEPAAKEFFLALPDEVINAYEFSNARFVRNLFERTWSKTIMRAQLEGLEEFSITADDFRAACGEDLSAMNKKPAAPRRIGFGV